MNVDHTAAVFDADFTNHICETECDPKTICICLNQLLQAHLLKGVMHPLVYAKELVQKTDRHKMLFENNVITAVNFTNIFQGDNTREAYYCDILVPQMYRQMNGEYLPESWNVLDDWNSKQNLGEIHSIAMCMVCGCGIFLSDDADSQKLVDRQMTDAVKVYDRKAFLNKFGKKTGISRKQKRSLAHKR